MATKWSLLLFLLLAGCSEQQWTGHRVLTSTVYVEKGIRQYPLLADDREMWRPISAKVGDMIVLDTPEYSYSQSDPWRCGFVPTFYPYGSQPVRFLSETWIDTRPEHWKRSIYYICEKPGSCQLYLVCVKDEQTVMAAPRGVRITVSP